MIKRNETIDVIRGLAVIGMVVFHILFLINFLQIYKIDIFSSFIINILGFSVRVTFFLLVGISSVILFQKSADYKEYIRKQLLRINKTLYSGILITAVTFVFFNEGVIYFGVLHSIALGILLSFLFVRNSNTSLVLGVIMLTLKSFLLFCTNDFYPLTFVFGFSCSIPNTFDYFPIVPWVGYIFLGQAYGKEILEATSKLKIANYKILKFVKLCGKHALIIYLVHIPIIFSLLSILKLLIE
ncbi:DUF1624 domain-containing protein [Candidatus Dojkabacteria bacterium]|nr:DUF1624 domain-containing protein [Candidatus Dojkabacteria bacterium]